LWIVGTTVGAYPYNFSSVARAAVDDAVTELTQDPDLFQTARRVQAASAAGQNRWGVTVRRTPLELRLESRGGQCQPVWPEHVAEVLATAEPGLTLSTDGRGCQRAQVVTADFDGDGSEDVALKGETPSGGAFVLLLNGESPTVRRIGAAGRFDSVSGMEAGYHELSGCFDDPVNGGRLLFPQPGFAISWDEKTATHYHFEGDELVEDPGSGC
jgi:hypothetical protein